MADSFQLGLRSRRPYGTMGSMMRRWTREEDLRLVAATTDDAMRVEFPDVNLPTLQRRRRMLRAQPNMSEGRSLALSGLNETRYDPKNFMAVVVGDLQAPFHDVRALASFNAFLHDVKDTIDCLIDNGDHYDNYAISRFNKSEGRGTPEAFTHERDTGTRIFADWRNLLGDDVDLILHKGNHEDRWDAYLEQNLPDHVYLVAGDRLDFASVYGLDELNVHVIPYKVPVLYGDMVVTHNTKSNTANPGTTALKHIQQRYGSSVLINHVHTGAMVTQRHIGGHYIGIENFMLADFNQLTYAEFPNWAQGFTVLNVVDGVTYPTPVTMLNQCFHYGGKLYTPEGVK